MILADAKVTVVVAPREKYRCARQVFDALQAVDDVPFRTIWVDESRAPRAVRRWVRARASRAGVRYVALDHQAGANECRMRGFDEVTTEFVLFLDNDAFLGPGSLAAMVTCMEETDASFVAPLYLERDGSVHNAGGRTFIGEDAAGRHLVETWRDRTEVDALLSGRVRVRTDALEMHCVLVRSSSLREAGGLDDRLLSSLDCADLGLRLVGLDRNGWLEPTATVTYDSSLPRVSDLRLYLGRWSRATVDHDITRFASTWCLDPFEARLEAHREIFLRRRRLRIMRYARGSVRRVLGSRAAARFERGVDRVFDRFSDAHEADERAAIRTRADSAAHATSLQAE